MSFLPEDRAAELREIFFESAQELLQTLNEEGLELEKHPGDAEVVKSIRRTVHTLKGDSAACGFRELSELAHELEDVLTPTLAAGNNSPLIEAVLSAADLFEALLTAYRSKSDPPSTDAVRSLIKRLLNKPTTEKSTATFAPEFKWTEYEQLVIADAASCGMRIFHVAAAVDPQCSMRSAALQLVRNVLKESGVLLAIHPEDPNAVPDVIEAAISSEHDPAWISQKCKIPAVVSQITVVAADAALEIEANPQPDADPDDDLLGIESTPVAAEQPHPVEEKKQAQAPAAASDNILRVEAERIDAVLNLVGELIIGKSMLLQTIGEFSRKNPKDPLRNRFSDAMALQGRVLHDLQRSVMKIRMVPVEQLFRRFPRMVRDIAKLRSKEVELVVSGQDTDLDKSILDALAEPLAHLVRNAVDHGIESPEARRAAGKPTRGTVRLNAYHHANQVVVEVSDDGRGIDREKVLNKALQAGLVSRDEAARMDEQEILHLIFRSGFSTADKVTEISGRGVGMDVVWTVMERLKGSVNIETRPGEGTTFLLKMPLTLAIIKALMFRVAQRLYAVPLGTVVEITRYTESEIHQVDGHEVLQLRDQVITLVRLERLDKVVARDRRRSQKVFVIIITLGTRKYGLVVDELVGEEELVIKALDDQLVATDIVSGASILGDGTVVLILDIPAVIARLGKMRTQEVLA